MRSGWWLLSLCVSCASSAAPKAPPPPPPSASAQATLTIEGGEEPTAAPAGVPTLETPSMSSDHDLARIWGVSNRFRRIAEEVYATSSRLNPSVDDQRNFGLAMLGGAVLWTAVWVAVAISGVGEMVVVVGIAGLGVVFAVFGVKLLMVWVNDTAFLRGLDVDFADHSHKKLYVYVTLRVGSWFVRGLSSDGQQLVGFDFEALGSS